jgi:N-acetylneuraminic acid mutarotase
MEHRRVPAHVRHIPALMTLMLVGVASCRPSRPPAAIAPAPRPAAAVTEGPSLPAGRACHAGGIVDGTVIVLGGSTWSADRKRKFWLDDSLLCDGASGKWVAGPRLPNPLAEMMFASDGHALYVAGGKDGDATRDDAYRVVRRNGAWTIERLPAMPAKISGGAAAMLGGVLYVAAGQDAQGRPVDCVFALDTRHPASGWKSLDSIPSPARAYPALAACGGRLYLLGGVVVESPERPTRQTFKDAFSYDPRAGRWARLPDLPTGGQGWVADAVDEHHLLVAGRGDTGIYSDVWLLDTRDATVRGLGDLVVPSFGAPLVPVSAGRWWFIGGEPDVNRSRTPRVSVIRMKPSTTTTTREGVRQP